MAFVAGMVWQRHLASPPAPGQEQAATGTAELMPGGEVAEPAADLDPGLVWTAPKRWTALADRPMRVATYAIPDAGGSPEGAECAVFHFGPSQGGAVEDNVRRWLDQFVNGRAPERVTSTVNGLKVHRVQVQGDYLAPSGPMMQSSGTKRGYMLIGAIVEGPAGDVYFKLTGPEPTVNSAASEFDAMLKSIRKG
jgi:hypothetical protein